jgi:hypothetical protein
LTLIKSKAAPPVDLSETSNSTSYCLTYDTEILYHLLQFIKEREGQLSKPSLSKVMDSIKDQFRDPPAHVAVMREQVDAYMNGKTPFVSLPSTSTSDDKSNTNDMNQGGMEGAQGTESAPQSSASPLDFVYHDIFALRARYLHKPTVAISC